MMFLGRVSKDWVGGGLEWMPKGIFTAKTIIDDVVPLTTAAVSKNLLESGNM